MTLRPKTLNPKQCTGASSASFVDSIRMRQLPAKNMRAYGVASLNSLSVIVVGDRKIWPMRYSIALQQSQRPRSCATWLATRLALLDLYPWKAIRGCGAKFTARICRGGRVHYLRFATLRQNLWRGSITKRESLS